MKLTFRLEDGELWACDDEGRSRRIDGLAAEQLAEWWEHAPRIEPQDARTAAVLADLGQARMARPHPTGRCPASQTALGGKRLLLGPLAASHSLPLADVLKRRHSAYTFGPLSLEPIATLLARTARVVDWTTTEDGYQATRRPTPSAGSRHPFDLHLVVGERVDGLGPGIYAVDPVQLGLVEVGRADTADTLLVQLGDRIGSPQPPTAAVHLVAHLDRTLSRYPAGMSLVWRDAGVVLQTLHLVATDLGLASRIVGTCGVLVDTYDPSTVDTGCLALGGPPH